MLIDDSPQTSQFERSDPGRADVGRELPHGRQPRHHSRRPQQSSRLAGLLAFLGAAGFVLAYALPGGTYDIVLRQEYGIAIWWLLAVGFALGLFPRARPGRPALILIGALVAYAVWTAISLRWSASGERTTAEIARVLGYVGIVVFIVSVLDRSTWIAAAMGLGFAALLVCVLALASRLAPGAFPPNPLYLPNATNRLGYPFGYWNAVGAWAAMSVAIGLAWSAHDSARLRRAAVLGLVPVAAVVAYLSYSRASVGGTAVAVIAVVAFSRNRFTAVVHAAAAAIAALIAILAVRHAPQIANGTGTSGAAGVFAAIVVAIVIAAAGALLTSASRGQQRRDRLRRRFAPLVAGAMVAALLAAGAAFGSHLATRAWHEFRHPNVAQSAADPASRLTNLGGGRYYFWRAAFDAFKAEPITGTGAGTFEFWWDRHATDSEFIRNAHSVELENMAELGIPGLVLIVVVLAAGGVVLTTARRRSRRTLRAGVSTALLAAFLVYVVQASVDWMWQSTAVTALALACAAVAAGKLSGARPRVRWYARIALVAAAACGVLVQVPGLLSMAELRRSQMAMRSGHAALAYSWATAAAGAEPWAASPYEQRALVLEAAGRFGQAAQDLRRAISREPTNFVHWLILSRVETERGDLAAAARAYALARQLRPHALVFEYAPYFSAGHR